MFNHIEKAQLKFVHRGDGRFKPHQRIAGGQIIEITI